MTISFTITGDTATAVSITAIVDAASGAAIVTTPVCPMAMSLSGSVWSTAAFTGPAAGQIVQWTAAFIWADGSQTTLNGTAIASEAKGQYADQTDLADDIGPQNLLLWSDLDNLGVLNVARVQRALVYADDQINNKMRGGIYDVPISAGGSTVVRWAVCLSREWLYRNYGQRDEGLHRRYDADVERCLREMGMYKTGKLQFDSGQTANIGGSAPRVAVVV